MNDTWEGFGTNKDFLHICFHRKLSVFVVENFANKTGLNSPYKNKSNIKDV